MTGRAPADARSVPSRDAIIVELRTVRERGLGRLHGSSLPALEECCRLVGLATHDAETPQIVAAIEQLLIQAVARLGGDKTGLAAAYTFGLVRGTKFWTATDRRRQAAKEQYVSVERFRKGYEPELVGYVADEILYICSTRQESSIPHSMVLEPARDPVAAVHPQPSLDELSRLLLTQLGRRRTAYPLDMSLEELAGSQLFVSSRVERYGTRGGSARRSVADLVLDLTARRSCLLLGEPGAGKSVTLYWVANECIRSGLIPIVLRAQDAAAVLGSQAWVQIKRESHSRLVVLVDGLDEALGSWAAEGIPEQLMIEISTVACLITSRTREFEQSAILKRADIAFDVAYVLQDWSVEAEFKEYLQRLARAGLVGDASLYHTVVKSEALTKLVSRPLYARMLTFVGGESASHLGDPSSLYGEYLAKLARVAEAALHRRQCQLPNGVLEIWKRLAWATHEDGASAATAVDLAAHIQRLSSEANPDCVRSAIDQILDSRDVAGRELGEFIHYSFFEYLVASFVFDRLRLADHGRTFTDLFKDDLSREVRHFLVAQIRLGPQRRIAGRLKDELSIAVQAQSISTRERLAAINLIVYLLSRALDDSTSLLEGLLHAEQSDFLQISVLWALCHQGSSSALQQFYERLESSDLWRSYCRGYTLYYYGDLDRENGPPYLDEPPFSPYPGTYEGLSRMMTRPEFRHDVQPQRRFIDTYTFLDIIAIREETMNQKNAHQIGQVVDELERYGIPAWMVDRLREMLADVRPQSKGSL